MSTVTRLPETHDNVVTSWLPVTSAFAAVGGCSSAIYSQDGGGEFIAFDPFYEQTIDLGLTCLPAAITQWWTGSSTSGATTVTSLGPLVCPEQYTTATASTVNSLTTSVACCPFDYVFDPAGDDTIQNVLGQCYSLASVGQVFNYHSDNTAGVWVPATTTITDEAITIYGIPVNGYTFAATTSSSSSSISSTSSTTSSTASPVATPIKNHVNAGLSTGAKAGIGIGVSLGVVALAAVLVWLFLSHRRKHRVAVASRDDLTPSDAQEMYRPVPQEMFQPDAVKQTTPTPQEMYQPDSENQPSRYELSAS